MRKLLIACLNLLLVFNSIGFHAINATEVDPPSEETYEPSLPTEETNSDDSIKENTDTNVSTEETSEDNTDNDNLSNNLDEEYNTDVNLSTEEYINTVDDSTNKENTLKINDSVENEQISTVTTRAIAFLDKEKFKNTLPNNATNLYFGTKNDYDLSKCTKPIDLGNNYSLYSYKYKDVDKKTELIDIYVICENGSKIFFPKDSSNLFSFRPLKQITFKNVNTSYVTDMSWMFRNCTKLTSLDLSNFNTDNVTSMSCMFYDCIRLTSLNLFSFNTQNVTSMAGMFGNCESLTSLDLSNFNTNNVKYVNGMFENCKHLTSLDLLRFNTQNVGSLRDMFKGCWCLNSLDLSNFNTDKVVDMKGMFGNCYWLTSLNLSSFNTQNVTDMSGMFEFCYSLPSLDLSSFNTQNVTDTSLMFKYCKSLHTIYVTNSFIAPNKSNNMFIDCYSLMGEQGTKYDLSKINGIYAHIDGGTSNPGYFSCKHIWDEGKVTTEPTCVNKGIKTFKCTQCDATKTEDIAALGHSYTAETIKADALKTPGTCTDKAIYYKSCERCGQVDTDENNTFEGEVDSTNHNYSDWKITKNPTCTETGSKEKTCSRCNNKIIEELSALGHEYSTEWTIDVEPTCTNAGSKSHHCTRKNCTSKSDVTEIPMTEHAWDEGKVTTEPTCVNKGIKTFKCTQCDATKTEDIAALGHELTHVTKKDATTEEFGNIEYWNCSKCKKNFSDSEGTNEITGSTVIPKLAPSIIKGDNQTVTEKEEKALSVTSNASYDDFIEVKVDGTTLDISKYAKAKGSTIITLNADYVSTLSVGAHTLDVVSKFGTATAHFKIEKKVEITPTPETNKSSTTDKTSTGWDDGGPFTTDKCGNVFDRWNNKIYEANGCNIGGYNLVRTSVED